ncbi:integrating conjugative element protein, PFL_4705 family [Methylophaga frappieri]|uniref:Integrating conjugative element protein, PFL_4705 family n=1 Tax=Methylophaga frappieri (strain ATCC BAA-2434 / DSM 25690 / JAM7) TaxID=754477 RepID=I1YIF0_METFJ|nr:TIGR03752 family integrating conjugative element protein [Methylophaga frappieri]AFJ02693.1 integrating conjugative element protein, PFL_4705 family [Methylophaga frappieri]
MSMVTSNRLLPLLAGSVVLMAVVVAVKSCSPSDHQPQLLEAVPQAPKPDADTPADTIKTLTANVSAMTSELNALRRDNTALKQENRDLIEDRKQIENNVLSRVQTALEAKRSDAAPSETTSAIAALTARVDSLANRFGTSSTQRSSTGSDIPVGLGLDGVRGSSAEAESLVWVSPLELTPSADNDKETMLNRFSRGSRNALDSAGPEVKSLVTKGSEALNTALPVYTVPRNATLIGSTGMTALVGRVPIQGQVRDPMPFKVITGKENLAANGLRIPGIEGMIWSGTAVGDWTLSCVTGKLESVTFVFEDGTIQTLSSDDNQRGGSSGSSDRPLGWISDARGIPCITGERKTNAPAFLTQRIGVMALEAAGEAAAQAETTTLINDSGSATSVVSGETGKYVLGKTLSGGSDEVAQWLRERQAQSFDAVFVPAGVELAIHVDHELPIDFHSNGRKLHHETHLFQQATITTGSGLD